MSFPRPFLALTALVLSIAASSCLAKTKQLAVIAGATGPLTKLQWLAGSWTSNDGTERSEEHWTAPSSNLILGINRTVSGGVTKQHEQLRIEYRDDGIFYVATPSGQETTQFKLTESGPSHAVFQNLQHDYPKRITYTRKGSTLTVRIQGTPDQRVSEWHWQRSSL